MTYAGVCYDGPLEGEMHAKETLHFHFAVWDGIPKGEFKIVQHTYVWSRPLRKWVFAQ